MESKSAKDVKRLLKKHNVEVVGIVESGKHYVDVACACFFDSMTAALSGGKFAISVKGPFYFREKDRKDKCIPDAIVFRVQAGR